MSSASELFYNRRSRNIRNSSSLDVADDLSFQRTLNGGHRRHGIGRMDRVDLYGGESFRRLFHSRVSSHRASPTDRESILVDEGSSQSAMENIDGNRDRIRYTGQSRLPGAVLLARERLVQRLRSVSVSGNNREINRPSSVINHIQDRLSEDTTFPDTSIWENEILGEWSTQPSVPEVLFVEMQTKKRSEGLSIEAICKLQTEIFITCKSYNEDEDEKSTAFTECSICLESFTDGEELTCLPCRHRFHTSCLYPWITTCGDCPNCRAGIMKSFDD